MTPRSSLARMCIGIAAGFALMLGASPVAAQLKFEGQSKEEIFQQSIDSGSSINKERARAYLAKTHPESAEGLFAAAWLAIRNGDTAKGAELYLECLDLDPRFEWCLSNYLVPNEVREDPDALENAIGLFEAMGDNRYKANVFANLLSAMWQLEPGGKERAKQLLDQHSGRLAELGLGWKVPEMLARGAHIDRDYDRAIELFGEAIAQGADDFEIWRRQAQARRAKVTPAALLGSKALRDDLLRPLLSYANDNPSDADVYTYLGNFLLDMKQQDLAMRYFENAFRAEPRPEFVQIVRDRTRFGDRATRFLRHARSVLPDDPYVQAQAAFHMIDFDVDVGRGRSQYEDALERISTDRLKRQVASEYAGLLEQYAWDWDAAYEVRRRYQPDIEESSRTLMVNRYRAADFSAAQRYLKIAESSGTANATFVEAYKGRIARAEANAVALGKADAYLDFLDRWSEADVPRTGAVDRAVSFDAGSTRLSPLAKATLKSVAAKLMADKDAFDLVEIAGFAEPDEAKDADSLAEQRAKVVLAALLEQTGFTAEKFTTLASSKPAMGLGEFGNRRATITPLASYDEAGILPPAGRPAQSLAFSPDGRLAVMGQPHRILDLATSRVRAELGRGFWPLFSPNGRLIAARSNFTETGDHKLAAMFIYDSVTGLALHEIAFDGENVDRGEFAWAPDSTALVFTTNHGSIIKYDLATRTQSWVTRANNQFFAGRVGWSPDGTTIAVGYSASRSIALLDSETGEVAKRLRGTTWTRGMTWSPDGKYLIAADDSYRLLRWNVADGTMQQMQLPHHPNRLLVSDATGKAVFVDVGDQVREESQTRQILKIDLERMAIVDNQMIDRQYVSFTQNGSFVALADDNLQVLNTDGFDQVSVDPSPFTGLDFSLAPEGCSCIISKDNDGLHVWNAANGRKQHSFSETPDAVVATSEGTALLALVEDRVIRFNLQEFTVEDIGAGFTTMGKAQLLRTDGNLLVVAGVESETSNSAMVEVRRLDNQQLVNRFTFPVITEAENRRGIFRATVTSLDIDADAGQVVALTRWKRGIKQAATEAREARIFDIMTGELAYTARPNRALDSAYFSQWEGEDALLIKRGPFASIYDRQGAFVASVDVTKLKTTHAREGRAFTTVRPGTRIVEVDWLDDRKDPVRIDGGDYLKNYHVLPELNLLVTAASDNSFGFHNLETGERALTINALRDSEWLAYTPSGLYAASLNGASQASLRFGSVVRPLMAYQQRLESREFVAEKLASLRTGIVGERLAEAEVRARSSAYTAPFLLSTVGSIPPQIATDTISLNYKVDTTGSDDSEPVIEFWVNGRALPPENLAGKLGDDGIYSRSFKLAPGNNTILAQILYRGARFEPVSVAVNSMIDATNASTRSAAKPRLFFLGVGVSDYQQEDADLEFADKDVRVVSEMLEAQQGAVFSEVRKMVLTDAEATKRDIEEKGIYEFLNYATENDVIVIYLAGHGAQHTNGELFLMTHDSDFNRPFSGFNMRMFADFLKGRPENQKAILFMDMCRAGTLKFFDNGARTTSLGGTTQVTAADVAVKLDGSGTVIFSSSSGAAPSYESAQWEGGHGAFTAAVLQALRGEADSGASGPNGFVDVLELQKYVIDKVPELTGSKNQQPKVLAAVNVEPYALTATE